MKPAILLSNGKYFDFSAPDPSVLDIEVIANALSNICRFTGHVSRFYSVAEHSVRCSYIGPDDEALERLMHDAAESLVNDMASPLKLMGGMEAYRAADHAAEAVVAQRFNLVYPWPASVKVADLVMLATERRDLLPPTPEYQWELLNGVTPLLGTDLALVDGSPIIWRRRFVKRFHELFTLRTRRVA